MNDDEFNRVKDMLDAHEAAVDGQGEIVNLSLSTEERLEIYNDVLGMLRSGEDQRHIAAHVVGLLNQYISSKMEKARDRKKGKSPIFRRVG